MNLIGSLNEQPLHAALKHWYAQDGGALEAKIDGFIVDVYYKDRVIEVQTGSFVAIKSKLLQLIECHNVILVYPVAVEKWILKLSDNYLSVVSRRKSPKRGIPEQVFEELVSLPELMKSPNFTLELALIQEEEVRSYSDEMSWRNNGWITVERRLIRVLETKPFCTPQSFNKFLPETLSDKFTTLDIAKQGHIPRRLAQKMAYCLCKMGCIQKLGKQGRNNLYGRL